MKTTPVLGYEEGGYIHNSKHEVLGITPERLKHIVALLTSPDYLYSRSRNYGTAIYHRDPTSPTGVINKGGIDSKYDYLVNAFHKAGSLSPTEDLRTAH